MWTIFVNLARLGGMQAVIALTALVRNKVVALKLGADGYGEFSQLLLVVTSATVIVGFGLELSLNRNIAGVTEHAERQRLLSQANAVNLTLSLVTLAIAAALILTEPGVFTGLGVSPSPPVLAASLIMLLFIPLDAAVRHRVAFLTALMDIKGLTSGRSLALIAGTCLSVPIVWFFDLEGAAVQIVLISAMILVFLDRRCRALGYGPWGIVFDWRVFRSLAAFGLASLFVGFVSQFSELFVRSILIRAYDAADNGLYQAAGSIVGQVKAIVLSSVGSYSIAMLSRDVSRGSVVNTSDQLLSVIVPIGAIAFAGLGLLSGPAILITYSHQFLAAQGLMPFILLGDFLWTVVWVVGAPLIALHRLGVWMALDLIFVAARVLLAIWLIPRYGPAGLAASYLIASVLHLATTSTWFLSQGFTVATKNVVLVCFGGGLIVALAYLGSGTIFDAGRYLLGFAILLAFAVYSIHATVGVPAAWARLRKVIAERGLS